MLMEHAVNGGSGDAVLPCDLTEALSMLTVSTDRFAIEAERGSSDVPAFEAGAPHAGTDSLDDQVAFELGDRSDDHDDGAAQWAARVDLLAEADELDVEPVEFVEHFEEVPRRAGDAIACPDQHDVELAAACIPHQIIEARPACLHAGDLVSDLPDDLIAALRDHLAEIVELGLGVLINGRDPHI